MDWVETIQVESRPGQGTAIMLTLPAADLPAETAASAQLPALAPGGVETLLIVEDADDVRDLMCRVLKMHGYTVLESCGGAEALALAAANPQPIHLLLTDMVMPGMNGPQLAERLLVSRPELRVLYLSGYSPREVAGANFNVAAEAFLPKPFGPQALLEKVREVLGK